MKRIPVLLLMTGMVWSVLSCGTKKEEAKTMDDTYETATPPAPTSEDLIAQGKELVASNDCKTCHHPINKIVGPPHQEVARKYEFTEANVKMLANKIIKGGSGVWGEIAMNPHPDLSEADAEKMARYVLSLDGEKEKK